MEDLRKEFFWHANVSTIAGIRNFILWRRGVILTVFSAHYPTTYTITTVDTTDHSTDCY